MNSKNLKKGSTLLVFILFLSFSVIIVSAVPPVQTTIQETGLTIAYPQYQYIKLNSNFNLYIHVQNQTNFLTGNKASCWLDLYNSTGHETMHSRLLEESSDYYINIVNNFTDIGVHSFIIQCNTTSQTGLANGIFEITPTGLSDLQWFYILIIGLSAGIIILGFAIKDAPLTILGSFGFIFLGLYILFNGIVGIRDTTTTRTIAIIVLMVGSYISVRSAMELIDDK